VLKLPVAPLLLELAGYRAALRRGGWQPPTPSVKRTTPASLGRAAFFPDSAG